MRDKTRKKEILNYVKKIFRLRARVYEKKLTKGSNPTLMGVRARTWWGSFFLGINNNVNIDAWRKTGQRISDELKHLRCACAGHCLCSLYIHLYSPNLEHNVNYIIRVLEFFFQVNTFASIQELRCIGAL